jgi:hypothetical protein
VEYRVDHVGLLDRDSSRNYLASRVSTHPTAATDFEVDLGVAFEPVESNRSIRDQDRVAQRLCLLMFDVRASGASSRRRH